MQQILQRRQYRQGLASYVATRQWLHQHVHGMTPVHFLRKLGLISRFPQQRWQFEHSQSTPPGNRSMPPYAVEPLTPEPALESSAVEVAASTSLEVFSGVSQEPDQSAPEPQAVPTARRRRAHIEEVPVEADQSVTVESPRSSPEVSTASPAGEATLSNPAELFVRRQESDRSPVAWAARLAKSAVPQAEQPVHEQSASTAAGALARRMPSGPGAPPISPSRLAMTDRPEPLSPSTRRFLKPLVGIEPASVPVHQGRAAAQLTSAAQADALTVGGIVALRSGYGSETPEQLGVLAHELTHIARQRQPRFVPPIARDRSDRPSVTPSADTMDEETLARRVESRVIRTAKAAEQWAVSDKPAGDAILSPLPVGENTVLPSLSPSAAGAQDWRGLPAPWEPLPSWMRASSEASLPLEVSTPVTDPITMSHASPEPGSSLTAPLQRAEHGRQLSDEASSAIAPPAVPAAESAKQVQPDLDALARQVYAILKRRLAAERRREFFS